MKAKKVLGLLLAVAMTVGTLAGCGNDATSGQPSGSNGGNTEQPSGGQTGGDVAGSNGGEEVNTTPFYMTLDPNVSGEIDIMTWAGDEVYHADLGHWDADVETDLTKINVAMIYAMAKKFNEMYPNVKINLYAIDHGNENWNQDLENFRAEHRKYPDIFFSTNLPQDVADGMLADMSVYEDDPLYQSFNETIMGMMNYYGVQAGLPQYMVPDGVYVNKELAELKNVDTPDPDWTIDEYTDFVTSADNSTFWGLIYGSPATQFIGSGTDTVSAALLEGREIDLASDQVMSLLNYIPKWNSVEIWSKWNDGAIDSEIMDDGWWWGYRFFCRNYCLTYAAEPLDDRPCSL